MQETDLKPKTRFSYKDKWFAQRQARTQEAAQQFVQAVLNIVQPKSVIDVGCATGEFLAAFQSHGVHDILGIDGPYVKKELLAIAPDAFQPRDLNQPFSLPRTYDLALSLEVAEHLNPESANGFITSLAALAPIIVFSAAIPHQGGTHHVNEQWPEYWSALFQQHGFYPVDALRKKIWNNPLIHPCYRQNALFFCKEEVIAGNEILAEAYRNTRPDTLSLVHPDIYLQCNNITVRTLRRVQAPLLEPLWRRNAQKWRNASHLDR